MLEGRPWDQRLHYCVIFIMAELEWVMKHTGSDCVHNQVHSFDSTQRVNKPVILAGILFDPRQGDSDQFIFCRVLSDVQPLVFLVVRVSLCLAAGLDLSVVTRSTRLLQTLS